MSRRIEVRIHSEVCAYVSGYGADELIQAITGRRQVWSVPERAWCVQAHTAADVIALADSRGWPTEVLHAATPEPFSLPPVRVVGPGPRTHVLDAQGGFW